MQTIAIAGISGYIGSRLLSKLDSTDRVKKIIGIDVAQPIFDSPKLQFYRHDVCKPLSDIFVAHEVDTAVNLAFILRPTRNRDHTHQIDVNGNANFLEACRQSNVRHILYVSSHTVYGAHPDNQLPLEENSPLRPLADFHYSWDKVETEQILHEFATSNKSVCITILRSCPVIGPNAANSVVALMFKPPVMIGVAGYDPIMQFIHEDDLIDVITLFLANKKAGIFNVAGDGELRYSDVAALFGKRMLKLPDRLLRVLMGFSWALHLQSDSPIGGLKFIKYPPIVSTKKLKEETGFQFRYSSKEALISFITAVKTAQD